MLLNIFRFTRKDLNLAFMVIMEIIHVLVIQVCWVIWEMMLLHLLRGMLIMLSLMVAMQIHKRWTKVNFNYFNKVFIYLITQ